MYQTEITFPVDPIVNAGKLAALDALHLEWRRYTKSCLDALIAARLTAVPKERDFSRYFKADTSLRQAFRWRAQWQAADLFRGFLQSEGNRCIREGLPLSAIYSSGAADRAPKVRSRALMSLGAPVVSLEQASTASHVAWWLRIETREGEILSIPLGNPSRQEDFDLRRHRLFLQKKKGQWMVRVVVRSDQTSPRGGKKTPAPEAGRPWYVQVRDEGMEPGPSVASPASDAASYVSFREEANAERAAALQRVRNPHSLSSKVISAAWDLLLFPGDPTRESRAAG